MINKDLTIDDVVNVEYTPTVAFIEQPQIVLRNKTSLPISQLDLIQRLVIDYFTDDKYTGNGKELQDWLFQVEGNTWTLECEDLTITGKLKKKFVSNFLK